MNLPPAILSTLRHDADCDVRRADFVETAAPVMRGGHGCTCPTLPKDERERRYAEWRALNGYPSVTKP